MVYLKRFFPCIFFRIINRIRKPEWCLLFYWFSMFFISICHILKVMINDFYENI
jgi:hypothetical protein